MSEINDAMSELKHSIKLYLSFSGGPSEYLCSILLKLIDCFDDLESGKSPKEDLDGLAFIIVEKLFSDIELTTNRERMKSPCPPELWNYSRTRDTYTDTIGGKYCVLRDMSKALKLLSSHNGILYPKITDLAGNEV